MRASLSKASDLKIMKLLFSSGGQRKNMSEASRGAMHRVGGEIFWVPCLVLNPLH
jgi:hypothetical protein